MTIVQSKLNEGVLTFGGTSETPALTVSCQATAVTLEPSVNGSGDDVTTLCGDVLTADSTTSWALKFTGIQDWTDVKGFVNYAFDHDGEVIAFTWTPNKVGPTYTGSVLVRAVVIGGDVNARITTDAEWPCQGKPVRKDATPPATVKSGG